MEIAIFLLIIFLCIAEYKVKEHIKRERFKSKVAGVCAGLALCGVCSAGYAENICSFAMERYENCTSRRKEFARRKEPYPEHDDMFYSADSDFLLFTALCAIEYAEKDIQTYEYPSEDSEKVIEYFKKRLFSAQEMTRKHQFYK